VGVAQVKDLRRFREQTPAVLRDRFLGVMQTVWSGSGGFLEQFHGRRTNSEARNPDHTEANCFRKTFEEIASER